MFIVRLRKFLVLSTALSFLVACIAKDPFETYSKDGISFNLPPEWAVIEDYSINESHRSISLITREGSIAGIELLYNSANTLDFDINTYLKRSAAAALPTEELKASAKIDFGERQRYGVLGKFIHISTPNNPQVIIEVYQITTESKNLFVVFNTPDSVVESLQTDFDRFIESVSI